MAKVYTTKCVIRKDKKMYQKGTIIEGLSAEEIERGLAQHWLEAVGIDEEPATVEDRKNKKGGEKKEKKEEKKNDPLVTERDSLLKTAAELGILDAITDDTPVEEIQQMITEAQAK